MIQIKLNTDVILAGNQGVNFAAPFNGISNTIQKLKALVKHHRQEFLTMIDVISPDAENNIYCPEFDCLFSPAEYEIFVPTNSQITL